VLTEEKKDRGHRAGHKRDQAKEQVAKRGRPLPVLDSGATELQELQGRGEGE